MKQKLHTKTINRYLYSTLSEGLLTLSKIKQVQIKILFMALFLSTLSLNGQMVGWPNKPIAITGNCDLTYRTFYRGANGEGWGVPTGEPPFQRIKARFERTGDKGIDGDDAADGEFTDLFEESIGALIFPNTSVNEQENIASKDFILKTNIHGSSISLLLNSYVKDGSICSIFNIEGRLLSKSTVDNHEVQFDKISTGIYIVKLESASLIGVQRIYIVF